MEKQNKSNDGDKLTDKAFSRLMITSVIGILVCIMCLCSATWAWFNAGVESNSNKLASGHFGLDVSFAKDGEEPTALTARADGTTVYTFPSADEYTVTLKMSDETTVTKGFCVIKVDGRALPYRTAAINTKSGVDFLTFTLAVPEGGMTVTFVPAWGLPADNDLVEMNETLTIGTSLVSED